MKREKFEITGPGLQKFKLAWNSSIREIESIVRDIARAEGTHYKLIGAESVMGENGRHERGSRTWSGANGRTLEFKIRRVSA